MKIPCCLHHLICHIAVISLLFVADQKAISADINVAVAASFVPVLQQLSQDFNTRTGHHIRYSAASSAVLYAQIKQGAPFDLFMSADQHLPQKLFQDGLAIKPIHYAQGQLVLWQRGAQHVNLNTLTGNEALVLANPKLSPYGAAAQQLLIQAKLWPWRGRLIMANNISQALLLTEQSGALGFAASAQFEQLQKRLSRQDGAQHFDHEQINTQQYMTQLNPSPRVTLFWQYLQSEPAMRLIEQAGYKTTRAQAHNIAYTPTYAH